MVEHARAGDDRAFEELYAAYRERIHAFILAKVRDHGRAEDLGQEVFMSALRQLRASDSPVVFKPWLYTIARNACIDEFRRTRRAREVPLEGGEPLAGRGAESHLQSRLPTPAAAVDSKQSLQDLRGAFDGLTESQHKLLVMREFEGLSYDEIGGRLGMTRQMVESGLFRARRKLGEEYDELASGRRCEEIQTAIDAGQLCRARGLGIKLRRRYSRHLAHCQPCRHVAMMAGVDDALLKPRTIADKVAGLLPLPVLRRLLSGRETRRLIARSQGGAGHAAAGGAGGAGLGAGAGGLGAGQAAALTALVLGGAGGGLIAADQAHAHRRPQPREAHAAPAPASGAGAGVAGKATDAVVAVRRGAAGPRRAAQAPARAAARGSVRSSGAGGVRRGSASSAGSGSGSRSGSGAGSGSGSGTTTSPGRTTRTSTTPKDAGSPVHRSVTGVSTTVNRAASGAGKTVSKTVSGAGKTVGKTVSGAGKTVGKAVSGAGKTVGKTVSGAGKTVGKAVSGAGGSGAGTTVQKTASGAGTGVQKTATGVSTTVQKTTSGVGTSAQKAASGIATGVQKTVAGAAGDGSSSAGTATSSTSTNPVSTLLSPAVP